MLQPADLDRMLWRIPASIPSHHETRAVDIDNVRLRLRDSGGNGPAVVFLCDPPNVVEHYDDVIAALSDDYRILIAELPGFGFSKPKNADVVGFTESVRAIESVLASLMPGRIVVCGPCVCGFVAAELARRGRLDIAGLVLVQTPDAAGMRAWTKRMDPKGRLRRRWLGQLLVRSLAKRLTRFWYQFATGRDTDPRPLIRTALGAMRVGGAYPLATMLQSWSADLSDRPVDTPALIIWGEQDRSHKETRRASTCAHAPRADIHRFEACGHFPDLEDPARFADTVRPFLHAHLGGTGT